MYLSVTVRTFAIWLFLKLLLDTSDGLQTTARPPEGSTVTVSTELPLAQCAVCTISGVNDTQISCSSSVTLVPDVEAKLLFNCTQPIMQSYSVVFTQTIECTKDACNPELEKKTFSTLAEFSRKFIWEVKAPEKTAVTLNLYGDSLTEMPPPCSDGFQYSVAISKTKAKSPTHYCRGGVLTELTLGSEGFFSLQVEPKPEQVLVFFKATPGPLRKKIVTTIGSGTTVVLDRDLQESECEVCTGVDPARECSSTEKTLTTAAELPVEFSCLTPEDDFSVKIKSKISCEQTKCSPATAEVDPSLFKGFKRTLLWEISVPDKTILTLGFPKDGLKSISNVENCDLQYTVSTTKNGEITTNKYCKGGTASSLKLHGDTVVTVEVPKEFKVDQTAFNVEAASRGTRLLSVTPDPNTIIIISRVNKEPDCTVCVNKGSTKNCNPNTQRLNDPQNTTVEFTCSHPQDVYNVEINRQIDCKGSACSGDIVQAETTFFPDFNRSFTWDVKVLSNLAFQLDFPELGMRQIPNNETCPDDHTYSLVSYLRSGPAVIGTFCKGGSVTTIMCRYKGRMLLRVPGNGKLDSVDFKLNVGPETSLFAIVKVALPRGVSDTELISPNYPGDFPDGQQMRWDFTVPGMHNYTMSFLQHTDPECLADNVAVQYEKENNVGTQLTLSDPQPQHQQGNFNMVLKNCETNQTLQGLSLSYRVSVMRSGHPVLCTVDLSGDKQMNLQIEKVGSDPFCEMKMNSENTEKINVSGGTTASLSFLDCPNDDVHLTATKVIASPNVEPTPLILPTLPSCLPMDLDSFTWNVQIPVDGTVDLVSPTGSLQQSLPGQDCDQSFSLHVTETNGFSVGDFCLNGPVEKIQVNEDVSITVTARDFKKTQGPFLNVSLGQTISESIIYRVSPSVTSPTFLATPNWPKGMKPSSTVTWIVTVPRRYTAHLMFDNISQPACEIEHTSMTVKMLGYEEELVSRREDEPKLEKLSVPYSFYLNMSNCEPSEKHFMALTKIVLEKNSNLLAILLGLAGVLLLMIIVLAVVCILKKKKKGKSNKGMFSPGSGDIFRQGDRHFTKTRSDNESHVYASIDDNMIYSHLMNGQNFPKGNHDDYKGIPMDSYQTFLGPTDGAIPIIKEPDPDSEPELNPSVTFMPSRPRTPIGRQDSLGFQDSRMVDNELYTFKSIGEINTIRLSSMDEESPPSTEDYL